MKLTVYRVADQGWRAGWNRYYRCASGVTDTIGAFLVTWRWCWSLRWRSA